MKCGFYFSYVLKIIFVFPDHVTVNEIVTESVNERKNVKESVNVSENANVRKNESGRKSAKKSGIAKESGSEKENVNENAKEKERGNGTVTESERGRGIETVIEKTVKENPSVIFSGRRKWMRRQRKRRNWNGKHEKRKLPTKYVFIYY